MYTNLHDFGKAYQGELQRVAGVWDEQQIESHRKSQAQKPGMLHRLLSRLSDRRKEAQPASPAPLREPRSSWI
jgi:hypothetical protein